jgi:DNA repair protein RecN (Recombination protein N)
MLLQLNIENFALIEKLTISFEEGFNVLSGETGAGKSILIDAISYVIGGKFNKDFIRTGENKTFVEAIFTIENERVTEVLRSLEIEYDDLIIISRETFSTGRSIIKVNGKSIIISSLKLISSTLLDIHGQHENQNLLDHNNHIYYLDYYVGSEINELLEEYSTHYKSLNDIEEKISKLKGNDGEREKLINYLKYQIDEINSAKLKENEDTELQERFDVLSHAEKITNALQSSYEILYKGGEESQSVYDALGSSIRELNNIQNYYEKVRNITNGLNDAYFILEQCISEIRSIKDDVYYDADELASINSRIYDIGRLKKKYGETINHILNYKNKIQTEYDELVNSGEIIEKLQFEKNKVFNKCIELGHKIHDLRIKAGILLEKSIMTELTYIGLEKSTVSIEVNFEERLFSNGCDKVQFMISTNPGEPLKPIEKVASGGELSRIMLALKTVFVDRDKIPTVIFDEIDTGISGRIAQRVAEKMFLISTNHQVFCVTHLPQIASMSDNHFLVYKEVKDEKTYTVVNNLNQVDKQFEVAKMIGGTEVTDITLKNAEELIKNAKNCKINILHEKK